jgi:hypothetical protein
MDLIQAEGVKEFSVCAIYTRQSSNTRSDLTSCQIQFEAWIIIGVGPRQPTDIREDYLKIWHQFGLKRSLLRSKTCV